MTNLQDGANRFTGSVLRRLWLWAPIAVGGALALALGATVITPLWLSLQRDSQRLREVEELKDQLSQQRLTARALDQQEEKVQGQRQRLVKVITGNGDVSTFLAQLDQMAKANGVQLDLFEPRAAAAATPANGSQGNAPAEKNKPAADPLEVEGLQRNSLVMAARGSFPELLAFLRQLESLNVLVVQSDLQLNQEAKQESSRAGSSQPEPVVLKLALSLYDKAADADVARGPGGSAGNAPPDGASGTGVVSPPAVPN
jgi:type IV pilus assembly protein PilO